MKSKITNIVSTEDIRKIKSMVYHQYNNSSLHPEIFYDGTNYRIDGITHLDENTINDIKIKCTEILLKEIINTCFNIDKNKSNINKIKISSVTNIGSKDDYVYDIGMGGLNHYFFANNILVHNTDSVYFSVSHKLKMEGKEYNLDKESTIELYQQIGKEVGKSFSSFMNDTFNTGLEKGSIIGADLEMIGSRGLFLKKKRYAILKYWEDGFRLDVDGKVGKIKAMGLEIKRSDTSKYIQVFLEDLLISLLSGSQEEELRIKVRKFKSEFRKMPSYEKGSPKTVNNLSNLYEKYIKTGKCSVGHVLAGIQWNRLRNANNDKSVPEVTDGTKVMVCTLKDNPLGIKSIGYPIECQEYLPTWFLDLPFDDEVMENKVLTKKLNNIFGILDMDIGIDETIEINNSLIQW